MTRTLLYVALVNGGLSEPVTREDKINDVPWGHLEKLGGVILQPIIDEVQSKREDTERPSQRVRTLSFFIPVSSSDLNLTAV